MNYSPININPTQTNSSGSVRKEIEPKITIPQKEMVEKAPIAEERLLDEESEVLEERLPPEVEVVSEKPKIDEELLRSGVTAISDHYIYVNNKPVQMPLTAEEVKKGEHQPLSSGWRWGAELTKWIILCRHYIIKKINGVFQFSPG